MSLEMCLSVAVGQLVVPALPRPWETYRGTHETAVRSHTGDKGRENAVMGELLERCRRVWYVMSWVCTRGGMVHR